MCSFPPRHLPMVAIPEGRGRLPHRQVRATRCPYVARTTPVKEVAMETLGVIVIEYEGVVYGRLVLEKPLTEWPPHLIDIELLDLITLLEFEASR